MNKYNCETCNFSTNSITAWEFHTNTEKHKSGGLKRKTRRDKRTDEQVKCEYCDYKNTNKYSLKSHILNNHSNKEERKQSFKYYCEKCDIGCFSKPKFEEHINGKCHLQNMNAEKI